MHDIKSVKGWFLMSPLFRKSFFKHLLIGGCFGILYLLFSHNSIFLNRLINSFFLSSLPPLIFGGFRFAKNLGTFDLFIYSHRKLFKYGKHHEKFEKENETIAPDSTQKLGSYYEYLHSQKPASSCIAAVLAGSFYLIISLFLTFFTL